MTKAFMQAARNYFQDGIKKSAQARVGIERECILMVRDGLKPIPYEGEVSITTVLRELAERYDWQPTYLDGKLLGLRRENEDITLEPAGQIELGSAPNACVSKLARDVRKFEHELTSLNVAKKLFLIYSGKNPIHTPDQMHWIPKHRYDIMQDTFRRTGTLGRHMMSLTSATQVSIDFVSEEDCQQKFRLACALAPLFMACYANSPLCGLKETGFIGYRAKIWANTDPSRCGIPAFVFEDGPFFDRYTEFALNVPLLFRRSIDDQGNEVLTAPQGETFAEFLKEDSAHADLDYFTLHLSSIFTEVRMKQIIEVRTPDCNSLPLAASFAALCKGIFYDTDARDAAWALVANLDYGKRVQGLLDAGQFGLSAAKLGNHSVRDLSTELCHIARHALATMDKRDGSEDAALLDALEEQVVEKKCSPGEELLEAWRGRLKQDPHKLMEFLSNTAG